MTQIDAIISEFGTATELARELGVSTSLVTEWKRQQSIPVKRWPALMALAKKRGVRLDEKRLLAANVAPERAA